MADGVKTALSEAVAAHRDGNGAASHQGELFALPASRRTELDEAIVAAQSDAAIVEEAWHQAQEEQEGRKGRKRGTRNMRTEEAARYYIRRHGDPLEQAVKLGAIPILAKGVLEALAQRLNCTKLEAAKFWASNNQAVMPYLKPGQRARRADLGPGRFPGRRPPCQPPQERPRLDAAAARARAARLAPAAP
jgi:hypothetical protein